MGLTGAHAVTPRSPSPYREGPLPLPPRSWGGGEKESNPLPRWEGAGGGGRCHAPVDGPVHRLGRKPPARKESLTGAAARRIATVAAFLAVALHLAFAAVPLAAVAGSEFAAAICSPAADAGTGGDPARPSPMQHGACLLCAVCAGGTPPLAAPAAGVATMPVVAAAIAVLPFVAVPMPQRARSSVQPRAPPVLA